MPAPPQAGGSIHVSTLQALADANPSPFPKTTPDADPTLERIVIPPLRLAPTPATVQTSTHDVGSTTEPRSHNTADRWGGWWRPRLKPRLNRVDPWLGGHQRLSRFFRPPTLKSDADRLPWFLREPDPISHSDANPNSDLNANSDTALLHPNSDTVARASSGVEYLNAVAG